MSEADNPIASKSGRSRHEMAKEAGELLALCMEYICADSGAPVNSIRFSKTDEGWLLTLKARSAARGGLVCFYGGRAPGDCMDMLMYDLYHSTGLKWKPDKYA